LHKSCYVKLFSDRVVNVRNALPVYQVDFGSVAKFRQSLWW